MINHHIFPIETKNPSLLLIRVFNHAFDLPLNEVCSTAVAPVILPFALLYSLRFTTWVDSQQIKETKLFK